MTVIPDNKAKAPKEWNSKSPRNRRDWIQSHPLACIALFFCCYEPMRRTISFAIDRLPSNIPDNEVDWYAPLYKIVSIACMALAFWILNRFVYQKTTFPQGFQKNRAILQLGLGVLIGGLGCLISIGVLLSQNTLNRPDFKQLLFQHTIHYPYLFSIFFLLLVGLHEESIWRGFVNPLIEEKWGSGWMLVIGSLAFGFWHLTDGAHGLVASMEICLRGFGYCAALLLTRRIWLSIGLHIGRNLMVDFFFGADYLPGTGLISYHEVSLWRYLLARAIPLLMGLTLMVVAIQKGQWRKRPKCQTRNGFGSGSGGEAASIIRGEG